MINICIRPIIIYRVMLTGTARCVLTTFLKFFWQFLFLFLFFQFYKYCLIFFFWVFSNNFFSFFFLHLNKYGLVLLYIYTHTHQLLFYFLLNHINYYGNSKTRLASAHSFGLFFKLTTTLFIDSIQPHEFYFSFLN